MERHPLQTILDAAVDLFKELVAADVEAQTFVNLLSTTEQVVDFSREIGQRMLQTYVDVRLAQVRAKRLPCPCGAGPLEWHAKSTWQHGTPFGDIVVEDIYAYCRTCCQSARPLHGRLGTDAQRWSLVVEEEVVDLATDESCQRAVDKLVRLRPGVQMGRTTALHLLHKHGEQGLDFIAEKLNQALEQTAQEGRREGVLELEVEYDGGMIPVATLKPVETPVGQEPERTPVRGLPKRRKDCHWEEAKLGLVQIPGEVEGRLYTVRPTTLLGQVMRDLLALAALKGWTEQTEVRGIADGAIYIRQRLADTFHASPFRFILDRPHAIEHLDAAGAVLEQRGGLPKATWVQGALARLERGEARSVVAELRSAAKQHPHETLRLEAEYFERNQDAVAYEEYRQRGWSTASSEVESGHRSVVQVRLKLPGTWWHPDKVQNILALRMIKVNGWWEEYWAWRRQVWREHATEFRTQNPRTRLAAA
jgi:hypothetical protein